MTDRDSASQTQSPEETQRVLLVDDHPVVREGYSMAIDAKGNLAVCGKAENADEAMDAIAKCDPHIVLVDLSLKGETSGMELIGEIKSQYPDLPVLVVSMHDESTHALPALRAGARGYVMKEENINTVIEGIYTVLEGKAFVSDKVKSGVLDQIANPNQQSASPRELLTPRELEIFERIGKGLTLRNIAEDLHISLRTVETHRNNIKGKLGYESVVELQHGAFEWANRLLDS